MSFNSFSFFIFLLLTIIIYFMAPKRHRWIVLLAASIFFYVYSMRLMVFYLLFAIAVTFYVGLVLDELNKNQKDISTSTHEEFPHPARFQTIAKIKKQKKIALIFGLFVIFGLLAFVKYYDFIAENISSMLGFVGLDLSLSRLDLLLPLGISFYTFQSAAYLIDIFRGKIKADRNIAKFTLFLSFFPQIVQGPISRYDEIADQLYAPHEFNYTRVKFGMQLILWGLFKKMVIADRVIVPVDFIFENYKEYNGFIILIGAALYSLQVYCDFSGGIDIARGIAQIIGITLPENFKRPFLATSIEDFWRRWHVTLGSWMRDYVLYPISLSKMFNKIGRLSRKLLGNKLGKRIPTFFAMLLTFMIVGVWHGPKWKFIAYGLYNGLLIIIGILLGPMLNRWLNNLHARTDVFSWKLFKIGGTFFLTTIGRYFSRAANLWTVQNMLGWTFFHLNPWVFFDGSLTKIGLDSKDMILLVAAIALLAIVGIMQEKGIRLRKKLQKQNVVFRWVIYLTGIFAIIIFGVYGIEYRGADFIYKGF